MWVKRPSIGGVQATDPPALSWAQLRLPYLASLFLCGDRRRVVFEEKLNGFADECTLPISPLAKVCLNDEGALERQQLFLLEYESDYAAVATQSVV